MTSPAVLPPSPAAVAEYFRRRRSTIAEFSPDNILHNERLWVVEICGSPESALDPAPIITRDQAARLDDPFSDKSKFGPRGQYTKCAGCGDVFESLGLRLCARCCKSSHAVQAKRCQECGAGLPPDGRNTLKFCSDTCRQKAHRRDLAVTDLEGDKGARRLPGPDTRVSVTTLQANRGLQDPKNVTLPPFVVPVAGVNSSHAGRTRSSAPRPAGRKVTVRGSSSRPSSARWKKRRSTDLRRQNLRRQLSEEASRGR